MSVARYAKLSAELATLKRDRRQLEDVIVDLNKRYDDMDQDIALLEPAFLKNKMSVARYARLSEELATLKRDRRQLEDVIVDLNKRYDDMDQDIAYLEAEMESVREAFAAGARADLLGHKRKRRNE